MPVGRPMATAAQVVEALVVLAEVSVGYFTSMNQALVGAGAARGTQIVNRAGRRGRGRGAGCHNSGAGPRAADGGAAVGGAEPFGADAMRRDEDATVNKSGPAAEARPVAARVTRWSHAASARAPLAVAVLAWLFGLATILSVLLRRHRHVSYMADILGRSVARETTVTASAVLVACGVLLIFLASGLRRRKERAWQLACVVTLVLGLSHIGSSFHLVGALAAGVVLAVLLATRRQFYALGDPATRWYAVRVLVELVVVGFGLGFLMLSIGRTGVVGHPSWAAKTQEIVLGLFGANGPLHYRSDFASDAVGFILGGYGILILCAGVYLVLRSAQPAPSRSPEDTAMLRALLDQHGERDSLGYFALRGDKSVIWSPSGKAGVACRVVAGVLLGSGDPIGDPEAWPGAIAAFLTRAAEHAWVPAVIGLSEQGAVVYARHGLRALEIGDEAVLITGSFTLDGRAMRGVRQAVNRCDRAGYTARVRRVDELTDAETSDLRAAAASWRGSAVERGYSMALSRVADAADPRCVVVTASQDGRLCGLLNFVPWGADGLSLDLMRRDRDAENGLNEWLIVHLVEAARDQLGVRRVSLNFAMFRDALERGQRIGAGPVLRAWRAILLFASRWWQIDSLYRFNQKFGPQWEPRYLCFPRARDLPRIAIAALQAEAFLVPPRRLQRMLRRAAR